MDTQPVLNPGQLRRIEAIHRGWLYQHLFAAACLLRRTRDLIAVSVERDEDVELILPDGRIYVQVKKRATALEIKDVETALTRFEEIQSAHASGARQGFCEFWIASNAEPSPELRPVLNSRNINAHFPGGVIRSAGDRWPGHVNEIIRRQENIRPIAVLDNAHRAEPATIKDLVDATPALRWVLLAQPTPQRTLLEALTKLAATNLDGWSFDTIIEECDDAGTRIDLETSRRVKRLTGGLPLFVKNISAVAQRSYSGSLSALCDEIEAATTVEELAQDAILGKVVAQISEMARKAASLMLLSPVPLTVAEFRTVLADGLAISEAQVTQMLKELRKWGVTQPRFDGSIGLHDAFRTVRFTSESESSPDSIRRAKESLLGLLKKSFGPGKLDRLVLFCRLMVDLGKGSEVPGILSNVAEHLYDLGRAKELMTLLAQLAGDKRLSIDDRFLAADTAAFWSMCANDDAATERFLAIMQELIDQGISDPEALSRLAMKQMQIAAERRDYAGVESAFKTAAAYAQGDPIIFRVVRYTYAVAQFKLQRFRAASDIAKGLVAEYGEVLGISVARDLRGTLLPHIIAALGPNLEEIDEIKRFADCFDLRARSLQELKEPYTNMFLYAHKLYVLSNSPSSAVKAGMDFVFSLVESNAVDVAKTFMENMLIPLVESHQLLENVIPIQSEYAVVLAYCGEVDKAKSVINQLRKISIDRPDVEAEFRYRANLVDDIERRGLRPRAMHGVGGNPLLPATAPINRNSPCACGSGLKYKKCCGSASAG